MIGKKPNISDNCELGMKQSTNDNNQNTNGDVRHGAKLNTNVRRQGGKHWLLLTKESISPQPGWTAYFLPSCNMMDITNTKRLWNGAEHRNQTVKRLITIWEVAVNG
jgi:hypothetical protein